MERPDYLIKGDIARLIPVIADTRNEQRVVSVLLAVMAAVPEFSRAILGSLGHRLSQRSIVNTYTEVVFKGCNTSVKSFRWSLKLQRFARPFFGPASGRIG